MKLHAIMTVGVIAGFFCCSTLICADETVEKQQMMDAYANELATYITQAQADLDETRALFDKENSEYPDNQSFNRSILALKQQQSAVMKELLKAVRAMDFERIGQLEQKLALSQHQLTMAATEKDMAVTLADLRKRASYVPAENQKQLNDTIKQLEETFHGILATEDTIFDETARLKSLYKTKDRMISECEKCFALKETAK